MRSANPRTTPGRIGDALARAFAQLCVATLSPTPEMALARRGRRSAPAAATTLSYHTMPRRATGRSASPGPARRIATRWPSPSHPLGRRLPTKKLPSPRGKREQGRITPQRPLSFQWFNASHPNHPSQVGRELPGPRLFSSVTLSVQYEET